jgi:hypothetical protein
MTVKSTRRALLICILLLNASIAFCDSAPVKLIPPEFLEGSAARAAIIDDSADPYFCRLEDHEMTAKTGEPITGKTHEAKLAECKLRYQAAVRDFTAEDIATLSWLVGKIQPPLVRDYPVFGNTPWSFIKIADTLEGGMPHTRGGHIILPEGVISRLTLFRNHLGDRSLPAGAMLLIHEQTHVLEREHPKLFEPFYTGTLHFIHAKRIASNQWIRDRQLVNPDGTVCDWVFPLTENGQARFVLPLIAFNEPNPTSLRGDIGTIAVTVEPDGDGFKPVLDGNGNPVVRPLNDVPEYLRGTGAERNNYHPNEITADRFAELVVIDDLIDKAQLASDPDRSAKMEAKLKPTRDWASKAFAVKFRDNDFRSSG